MPPERTKEELTRALAAQQDERLALQRRLAQAERLAALGALAAKLAHELGTPLHSVAGHLDLVLSDRDLSRAHRERLEIVAGEVDRLTGLIRDNLKDLRAPQPKPEPTDLNALLSRTMDVMAPLLQARAVAVELDLAPNAAVPFDCDPRQVEQVLLNLIQNSLDAMPGGGRLVIRTAVTETGRAISVCDTGSGAPTAVANRVFEPFFTTKEAGRGTGLGLSVCLEIARNHGGGILFDSRPEIGTVVTLTLGEVV